MTPGPSFTLVRDGDRWRVVIDTPFGDLVLWGERNAVLLQALKIFAASSNPKARERPDAAREALH